MLRAAKLFGSIQQSTFLSRQLNSIFKIQFNNYHYQTDIYTSKFENTDVSQDLRRELLTLNKYRNEQPNLYRFIKSYQEYGYKRSQLDPLNTKTENELSLSELEPEFYGLLRNDNRYSVEGLLNCNATMTIEEIEKYLKKVYSQHITIEFEFLQREEEKLWLAR